jgi:hypothetical protein
MVEQENFVAFYKVGQDEDPAREAALDREAKYSIAKQIAEELKHGHSLTVAYRCVGQISLEPGGGWAREIKHVIKFVNYPKDPWEVVKDLQARIRELEGIISDHSILAAGEEGY